MSKYTVELKEYIESFSHYNQVKFPLSHAEKIEIGRTQLFDFNYPIFDDAYKKVFETHFIRKFYMREIGFETMGLFKFQLETWLLINMPYFNKMFESELINYDPLTNTKIDVTQNRKTDKTQNDQRDVSQTSTTDGSNHSTTSQDATGSLTEDNFDRQLESDNPDSRLAITTNDGEGVIEYAKSIKENNENSQKDNTSHAEGISDDTTNVTTIGSQNDTLTSGINETQDFVESKFGKIGSQTYAKMVGEYRESLLRIEKKIFDEMQDLFMLVY